MSCIFLLFIKNIPTHIYHNFKLYFVDFFEFHDEYLFKLLIFQDVTKLTPLSREVISRQATINIGNYSFPSA